jgi:hypothetical protein
MCNENRFIGNNPVNSTYFFSLQERLKIQYSNKKRAAEFRYRSTYLVEKEKDAYGDIFDGKYVKYYFN